MAGGACNPSSRKAAQAKDVSDVGTPMKRGLAAKSPGRKSNRAARVAPACDKYTKPRQRQEATAGQDLSAGRLRLPASHSRPSTLAASIEIGDPGIRWTQHERRPVMKFQRNRCPTFCGALRLARSTAVRHSRSLGLPRQHQQN